VINIIISVKPCLHWRLLSPNSETVAKNGDCRRIRQQIVAEFGDYSRQCGQGLTWHYVGPVSTWTRA